MSKGKSAGVSLAKMMMGLVAVGLVVGLGMAGFSTFKESGAIKELSEVAKFQDATKEFKGKYNYLPGDLPSGLALQLAFTARNGAPGRGDGNGLVEGVTYTTNKSSGIVQSGEPLFFWEDLFSAGLTADPFNTAADVEPGKDIVIDNMNFYLPKVGKNKGEGLYVYSDKKVNYFSIAALTSINGTSGGLNTRPGLSVREAYDIDKKIDDGAPTTGTVLARYVDEEGVINAETTPTPTAKSCIDKVSGGYSISVNDGRGINCGLSFVVADH
jgi:hypothetical protein